MATKMPKGPFRLVTVNTAPQRATQVIGRVAVALYEKYTIHYEANCTTIDEVAGVVERVQPDILFCASMWTAEESARIVEIARSRVPNIKTHAIPHGLQVEKGPDGVVEHLLEIMPPIMDSIPGKDKWTAGSAAATAQSTEMRA